MKFPLKKKGIIVSVILLAIVLGVVFTFGYAKNHKEEFVASTLSVVTKAATLLPLQADTKQELEVVNALTAALTANDNVTRNYLLLLQNNFELRPGGGFLGQYAVLTIKNSQVVNFKIEDANLLDQRITVKVTPPWSLKRWGQVKNWKMRDSNYSADFPTNADKAQYFYRLGGGWEKFDGVIAINAVVLDHILGITGPITIDGYGTYTTDNATLKLEEQVEKAYLGDNVSAEAKQARKTVMKLLGKEIINRIATIDNIPKLTTLGLDELRNKDVQLYFKNADLQAKVASVHWDGTVAKDWSHDYLYIVDANLGALKTDYYIKRSLSYTVDFTTEKPTATVEYTYNHTATHGDWRTSDYHTYTRVLAPFGSKYIEQSRLNTGGITSLDRQDFNKTEFGYKVDALIGRELKTGLKYELPASITLDHYSLLIQKQSGIGTIPVTITLKTPKGDITQHLDLKQDTTVNFDNAQ